MGYRNADRVYANWAHLQHRSHRLLTFMALQAKDSETPEFYGGLDACAEALGGSKHSAKAALQDLKVKGATSLAKHSAPGQGSRWALHLGPNRDTSRSPVEGQNRATSDSPVAPPEDEQGYVTSTCSGLRDVAMSKEQGYVATPTGLRHVAPNRETEISTSPTPVVTRAADAQARGTRLDPNWLPSKELADQMRAECPGVDLKREHAKFVDYWVSKSGAAATKRDWPATWRNWIRTAHERLPAQRQAQPRMATTDRKLLETQALVEELRAAEHHTVPLALPGGAA